MALSRLRRDLWPTACSICVFGDHSCFGKGAGQPFSSRGDHLKGICIWPLLQVPSQEEFKKKKKITFSFVIPLDSERFSQIWNALLWPSRSRRHAGHHHVPHGVPFGHFGRNGFHTFGLAVSAFILLQVTFYYLGTILFRLELLVHAWIGRSFFFFFFSEPRFSFFIRKCLRTER